MDIRRLDLEEWAEHLPETGFEPFHLPAALSVLADHTRGELRLLGGFRGEQAVGLFAAFVRSMAAGRTVYTPPPGKGIPHLGPLLMPTSPKQSKRGRVNREFVAGALDELDARDRLTVTRIMTSPGYTDPRPFEWCSLTVRPFFTYRVDATDLAETKTGFSQSLRREIRDARDAGVTVEREAGDSAATVYEDTRSRFEAQGEPFELTRSFVDDLVDALGDRARTFVARDPSGAYLGGILALYSNDAAYFWLGGARATYEGSSVNGLVHWRLLQDLAADPPAEGATQYDLVGANTERLCRYKSKFGGRLVPYYIVESEGLLTPLAKTVYRFTNR